MKVEVFHHGQSMGLINFDEWSKFEKYILRWISHPVHVSIKFDVLKKQIAWYSDVVELIHCAQQTQKNAELKGWDVKISRYGKMGDDIVQKVA